MSNSIKYFLGIDGGGTKTEFLLTDLERKKIKRLFLGNSNPVNHGIENTLGVLDKGIREICKNISMEEISVFAGIAGSGTGENKKLIYDFLSSFGFGFFGCGSDIDLALEISLKGRNGTCVIMGTGIVAYGSSDGKLYRAGGYGYMIDKGGSGFHFGSDALNYALKYIEGENSAFTIYKLTEKKLGKKPESALTEIYSGGPSFVASLAPVVFEAFSLGDTVAKEIIERNTREAAKLINSVRRKLNVSDEKIVICGGLCKQKEILSPFLVKYTDGNAMPVFLEEPMVNGAITIAERLCENA